MALLGNNYSNRLTGSIYSDQIYGYGGDDILIGGSGNDTLYAGSGRDDLYGGNGSDILFGGTGSDFLVGGAGSDAFVFNTRNTGDGVAEADIIWDFAAEDMIAIDNAAYPSLGNQGWIPSWMFKVVGTGAAVDVNDRLIYNARSGVLTYDWNGSGDGGRVVLAVLDDAPTLTAADIYIL